MRAHEAAPERRRGGRARRADGAAHEGPAPREVLVLAVGCHEMAEEIAAIVDLPRREALILARFDDLAAGGLPVAAASLVISPILSADFDVLDLAAELVAQGFRGAYRAFSRWLPDPDMVRAEVRDACPGLDFDVFRLAPPPRPEG